MDGGSSSLKAIAAALIIGLGVLLYLVLRRAPGPTVAATSPAPGTTVPAGAAAIVAEVHGVASLAGLEFRLDGQAATPVATRLSAGIWRLSLSGVLPPGPHEALVTLRDGQRREQAYHWSFTVAPPPITTLHIDDLAPAPGDVVAAGLVTLGVTFIGPDPVAAATLQVGEDRLPLQLEPIAAPATNPAGQRLVASKTLQPGTYRIAITVRDTREREANRGWTIEVVPSSAPTAQPGPSGPPDR